MSFHPHLHCIVSAGGWNDLKQTWVPAKKLKNGFFIPQKVAAACFKKHFLYAFSQLWEEGSLLLPKELLQLNHTEGFKQFYKTIAFKKNWVVKILPPLDNPQRVIDYLGRYVFRIAITDSRIAEVKKGEQKVVFQYKDYAAQKESDTAPPMKTMTLDALEFIRRFAQHVLPKSFQKIRYFGIYATACRPKVLPIIAQSLGIKQAKNPIRTVCQIILAATGQNPNLCPCCAAQNLSVFLLAPVNPPIRKPKTQNNIVRGRSPPQNP